MAILGAITIEVVCERKQSELINAIEGHRRTLHAPWGQASYSNRKALPY
jgi:hypothetical protein